VRTTVKVGEMTEPVDAIKYYTRQLEDLNMAVQKEQSTAELQAQYLDKVSGATSFNVIESLLEVWNDYYYYYYYYFYRPPPFFYIVVFLFIINTTRFMKYFNMSMSGDRDRRSQ
jgi:hypothetical protein